MTVKAFIKSEEKKRSKEVEAVAPRVQPSDTTAPAAETTVKEASVDAPNGSSNGEHEVAGVTVTEQGDAGPNTDVC